MQCFTATDMCLKFDQSGNYTDEMPQLLIPDGKEPLRVPVDHVPVPLKAALIYDT